MVKRPGRHALPRYTLPSDLSMQVAPIGVVHSPFQWRDEAPRQPTVGEPRQATIVLRPGLQNALKDLIGFEYCWVLFWFNYSRGWKQQIVPPRDTVKRGLFSTRSPDRPNAIGLSAVRLVAIKGSRVTILGHDLLNGTPVLDLKPYIPAYDAFPLARSGWVEGLQSPGPDHRYR
jgi:tRNA-Thr(GGU) m(6)t(6)A37 methyltransferase TsaA